MIAQSRVDSELQSRIEAFLRESFVLDNPVASEAVQRMLRAGGKRVRPRIALLAAQAGGSNPQRHLELAAYIELIHVATLIHDDVVDNAQMRRGINATAVDYGNRISVLAGDYLFAWIFKNITAKYRAPIPHILSATLAEICDGEVLQLRAAGDLSLSVDAYVQIVKKKTAALFAAGAQCGALDANAAPALERALSEFGLQYGIAFQMKDDLLDVTAEQSAIGKPVGNDLRESKVTLPLLFAIESSDGDFRRAVERFFQRRDEQDIPPILQAIEASGSVERTRAEIARYVEAAKRSLQPLAGSEAALELAELADALVKE